VLLGAADRRLKAVHIGRYWRKDADVVFNMLQGLIDSGADVLEIDANEYPAAIDLSERKPRPGSKKKSPG